MGAGRPVRIGGEAMALVPIFKGRVSPDGKLILRETERARRQEWLQHLAGHEIELVMRRQPRQRTLDQNNYLHAVPFRLMHEQSGLTVDEVKRLCLAAKFGTIGTDERGWPIPLIAHTSSLEVEQADDLIEFLPPFSLERFNGLEIPLPGEVDYR